MGSPLVSELQRHPPVSGSHGTECQGPAAAGLSSRWTSSSSVWREQRPDARSRAPARARSQAGTLDT